SNAYEAMPQGGVLKVEAHAEDGEVRTSVSDNGIGMDTAIREHVFEPFFTQKLRGVGLGLTVTKRIVKAHRGKIHVMSEPGEGTSFMITLPVNSDHGSGNNGDTIIDTAVDHE